jgi:hypothetical protein
MCVCVCVCVVLDNEDGRRQWGEWEGEYRGKVEKYV